MSQKDMNTFLGRVKIFRPLKILYMKECQPYHKNGIRSKCMRSFFRVLLVSPRTTGNSGNTPSKCPNLVKHEICKLKNCPEENPPPVQIMGEFVKKMTT